MEELDVRLTPEKRTTRKFWVVEDRRPGHEYEFQVTLAKQPNNLSITKETSALRR